MSNIATWGDGQDYHQDNVLSSFLDIDTLINDIRGVSSSINRTGNISVLDEPIEVPFEVDVNARTLFVHLATDYWSASNPMNFSLLSPSGIQYSTGSEFYSYISSLGRFEFTNPEHGRWTAMFNTTIPYVSKYSFNANIVSDIIYRISDLPKQHMIDTPLFVSVNMNDFVTPITGAVVEASVSRDDWKYKQFLYDDGFHNDGEASDGVYGNYLYIYNGAVEHFENVEGKYKITIETAMPSHSAKRINTYHIEMLAPEIQPYTIEGRTLRDGWNWVGFPRLNREDDCANISPATISLSPFLTSIKSDSGGAEYFDNHWICYGIESLDSRKGYKLCIQGIDDIQLYEQGTLVDTTSAYSLIGMSWNWITYPCYERCDPLDALEGVVDDIDYIMAQQWSMIKRNGEWHADPFSRTPILRYGDSILIRAERNTSFFWNSTEVPPEDIRPIKTSILTYNEKAEYETLMIEGIEGNPVYDEIGVFQDGICVGARVAEGYPLQILAYTDASKEDSADLEIRIASATKGFTSLTPTIVQDYSTMSFGTSLHPSPGAFRSVNLKTGNQVVPPAFSMSRNYPNPFNPSTTITFGIPTTGVVKLDIYNVKGQKVKNLLKDNCEPGYHQIVWDGTDNGNRGVGSGIYFARIEYSGKSQTQKMMLMK